MFSELKNNFNGFSMIDVHQNATLSESFEGERSRVIANRCKLLNQFRSRLRGMRYTVESRLKVSNLVLISFCVPRSRVRRILFEWEDILQFRPGIADERIHWRSFPCNHKPAQRFFSRIASLIRKMKIILQVIL